LKKQISINKKEDNEKIKEQIENNKIKEIDDKIKENIKKNIITICILIISLVIPYFLFTRNKIFDIENNKLKFITEKLNNIENNKLNSITKK